MRIKREHVRLTRPRPSGLLISDHRYGSGTCFRPRCSRVKLTNAYLRLLWPPGRVARNDVRESSTEPAVARKNDAARSDD